MDDKAQPFENTRDALVALPISTSVYPLRRGTAAHFARACVPRPTAYFA